MRKKAGFPDRPSEPASHPGPQKEKRRLVSATSFLGFLIAIVLVLFFQSFVRDNCARLPPWYFLANVAGWKILDTGSAATLLIGLISAAWVNKQVILGYRPFFNYLCHQTPSSVFGLVKESETINFWNVNLMNVGSGPAIVVRSFYRVWLGTNDSGGYGTYQDAINKLASNGFTPGRNFALRELSHGWSMAPKGESIIFEATLPSLFDQASREPAIRLRALDIKVEFKGLLEDLYTKEIYCIPRKGINPERIAPSVIKADLIVLADH